MVITIDGGVATGTTTLAKDLALALGIPHIDSGSIYRAVAYLVLAEGVDPNNSRFCTEIAKNAKFEMPDGEVLVINGQTVVEINSGQRVDRLHTAELDRFTPVVAAHKGVRDIANQQQRQFAAAGGTVADGRDTGTVVFPRAELKLFLTCGDKEAARRRSEADGRKVTVAEIRQRNKIDSSHKFGALAKATDAIEIDTTYLTNAEIVEIEIVEIVSDLISKLTDQRPAWIGRKSKSGKIERK